MITTETMERLVKSARIHGIEYAVNKAISKRILPEGNYDNYADLKIEIYKRIKDKE